MAILPRKLLRVGICTWVAAALGLLLACGGGGGSTATPVAPAFITQPANQTVVVGATATFTVACTGTPAPTYQWYEATTPIPGATSYRYTTPATTLDMSGGLYSVTVTNSMGSVTSNPATLTVNTADAPVFTTQPQDQHVTAPATATFTAAASGTPAPTYQWYLGMTAIPSATSASYTTPATTTAMSGGSYTVVATNSAGNVSSNAAYLTVAPAVNGIEGLYCGTMTVSGAALPMIAAVASGGEFRFAISNRWVGSATLSGATGSGTLYTSMGAIPNSLSLTEVVTVPGTSIAGSYAYGAASGTFTLTMATNPSNGDVLYNHPSMVLPATGLTTTTTGNNTGWQSSAYPWSAVAVDAGGNITMTVNHATVTGTLTQITAGTNLYRMNLLFANSGSFTGLGWWSGASYTGPANANGFPLTISPGPDGFFANVFYCILSTPASNTTSNLGLAAGVGYPD